MLCSYSTVCGRPPELLASLGDAPALSRPGVDELSDACGSLSLPCPVILSSGHHVSPWNQSHVLLAVGGTGDVAGWPHQYPQTWPVGNRENGSNGWASLCDTLFCILCSVQNAVVIQDNALCIAALAHDRGDCRPARCCRSSAVGQFDEPCMLCFG